MNRSSSLNRHAMKGVIDESWDSPWPANNEWLAGQAGFDVPKQDNSIPGPDPEDRHERLGRVSDKKSIPLFIYMFPIPISTIKYSYTKRSTMRQIEVAVKVEIKLYTTDPRHHYMGFGNGVCEILGEKIAIYRAMALIVSLVRLSEPARYYFWTHWIRPDAFKEVVGLSTAHEASAKENGYKVGNRSDRSLWNSNEQPEQDHGYSNYDDQEMEVDEGPRESMCDDKQCTGYIQPLNVWTNEDVWGSWSDWRVTQQLKRNSPIEKEASGIVEREDQVSESINSPWSPWSPASGTFARPVPTEEVREAGSPSPSGSPGTPSHGPSSPQHPSCDLGGEDFQLAPRPRRLRLTLKALVPEYYDESLVTACTQTEESLLKSTTPIDDIPQATCIPIARIPDNKPSSEATTPSADLSACANKPTVKGILEISLRAQNYLSEHEFLIIREIISKTQTFCRLSVHNGTLKFLSVGTSDQVSLAINLLSERINELPSSE